HSLNGSEPTTLIMKNERGNVRRTNIGRRIDGRRPPMQSSVRKLPWLLGLLVSLATGTGYGWAADPVPAASGTDPVAASPSGARFETAVQVTQPQPAPVPPAPLPSPPPAPTSM